MTIKLMTPEFQARLEKSFGNGLVIFGAQRPQPSPEPSTSPLDPPLPQSGMHQDPDQGIPEDQDPRVGARRLARVQHQNAQFRARSKVPPTSPATTDPIPE